MAEEEQTPPDAPEEPTTPRAFDESYQTEVADKLRVLIEELESVEGTASVRRALTDALRQLPS